MRTAGSSAAGAYRQGIPGETLGQGQSPATAAHLRSGNCASARGDVEFLKEALALWAQRQKIRLVRADSGFFGLRPRAETASPPKRDFIFTPLESNIQGRISGSCPTQATLMNELGVSGKLVADQFGHSSDVNQNVYTQSLAENRLPVVIQLEKGLFLM